MSDFRGIVAVLCFPAFAHRVLGEIRVKNMEEDMQTRGLRAGQHQQTPPHHSHTAGREITVGWLSGSLLVMINFSTCSERLKSISLCVLNGNGLSVRDVKILR